MNKAIIPAVCFIVGTTCGVFIIPRGGSNDPGSIGPNGGETRLGPTGSGTVARRGSGGEGGGEGSKSNRAAASRGSSATVKLSELLELSKAANRSRNGSNPILTRRGPPSNRPT